MIIKKYKNCYLNHAARYVIIEDIIEILETSQNLNEEIIKNLTNMQEMLDKPFECKENELEDLTIKKYYILIYNKLL